MNVGVRAWHRRLPLQLLVLSAAMIAAAFAIDIVVPGSARGFGRAQRLVAGLGVGTAALAAVLASPVGQPLRLTPAALRLEEALQEALKLLALTAQVGLLVVVMRLFRIESPALYDRVGPLVLVGFVGHHLLPPRYRLAAFVGLSLGSIVLVFEPLAAAWLVGLGLMLIGICHLPLRFGHRVAAVTVLGVLLALLRADVLAAPWPGAIWPILGSMFMFRLIVYLYDLRHARTPAGLREALAYFFLLPNVVFPLFPVIDFATFRRTYYDQDPFTIYQQGARWMARGLTHLVAYRFVYQYLTMSPADVNDLGDLVRYALANFGLYLRVSGQFHLIVGTLHLFGFRLPETHRFFYVASSFTDFWRRINIYWKDFMVKMVYNPAYFRLRRHGEVAAMVVATALVFTVTWGLHSYQWFWLLGTVLLSWTDTLFWGALAVLLVGNVLLEARKGRQRTFGARLPARRDELATAVRTAGVFTVICVLWTVWTSPSVGDAASLLSAAARPTAAGVLAILGTLAIVAGGSVVARRLGGDVPAGPVPLRVAGRQTALAAFPLALLWLVTSAPVAGHLGVAVREVARDLRVPELSRADAARLQRGYYENIVGVNRFNSELWEVYTRRGEDFPSLEAAGVVQQTGTVLGRELRPLSATMYRGRSFRTNRWGMRDREYPQRPAPGVRRIAVLGASYVMGWGVSDGETFEALVEERLNRGRAAGAPGGEPYESLNFAVGGYTPVSQEIIIENGRVFGFEPDVVLLVAHGSDLTLDDVLGTVLSGRAIPIDTIEKIVAAAGVRRGMPRLEATRRLQPYSSALVEWAYGRIAALCRNRGVTVAWAYVPMPRDQVDPWRVEELARLARKAGFRIVDVGDVYAGHDQAMLALAEWDRHPNAQGHQLIAEHLERALRDVLPLLRPEPAARTP